MFKRKEKFDPKQMTLDFNFEKKVDDYLEKRNPQVLPAGGLALTVRDRYDRRSAETGCRILQAEIRHGEPKGFPWRHTGVRIVPAGTLFPPSLPSFRIGLSMAHII